MQQPVLSRCRGIGVKHIDGHGYRVTAMLPFRLNVFTCPDSLAAGGYTFYRLPFLERLTQFPIQTMHSFWEVTTPSDFVFDVYPSGLIMIYIKTRQSSHSRIKAAVAELEALVDYFKRTPVWHQNRRGGYARTDRLAKHLI